jgi:hypothetical protein
MSDTQKKIKKGTGAAKGNKKRKKNVSRFMAMA